MTTATTFAASEQVLQFLGTLFTTSSYTSTLTKQGTLSRHVTERVPLCCGALSPHRSTPCGNFGSILHALSWSNLSIVSRTSVRGCKADQYLFSGPRFRPVRHLRRPNGSINAICLIKRLTVFNFSGVVRGVTKA